MLYPDLEDERLKVNTILHDSQRRHRAIHDIYATHKSETKMCSVMGRHRYLFGRHANGGLRTCLESGSGSGAAAVALSCCRLRRGARKVLHR